MPRSRNIPRYQLIRMWSREKELVKEKARLEKGIDALNTVIQLMQERKTSKGEHKA